MADEAGGQFVLRCTVIQCVPSTGCCSGSRARKSESSAGERCHSMLGSAATGLVSSPEACGLWMDLFNVKNQSTVANCSCTHAR
jgi:hypothetical protein